MKQASYGAQVADKVPIRLNWIVGWAEGGRACLTWGWHPAAAAGAGHKGGCRQCWWAGTGLAQGQQTAVSKMEGWGTGVGLEAACRRASWPR